MTPDRRQLPSAARGSAGVLHRLGATTRRTFLGAAVLTTLSACAGSNDTPLAAQDGAVLMLENGDGLLVA